MNSVTEDFFKLNHRIFNFYINTSKNKNLNNENKVIITSMTKKFFSLKNNTISKKTIFISRISIEENRDLIRKYKIPRCYLFQQVVL